jgi:hypothetical protein
MADPGFDAGCRVQLRLRPAFLEKYLDRLLSQLTLLGYALEDNAGQTDHKPSKPSILFQQ